MIFARTAQAFKPDLLVVESGTIYSIIDINDFVDASGITPETNGQYGMKNWMQIHAGSSVHRAEGTLLSLTAMVTVLGDWPANSPDLNRIENLRAILKAPFEEESPSTKEELINVIMAARDNCR
jgi:hypothetical protein